MTTPTSSQPSAAPSDERIQPDEQLTEQASAAVAKQLEYANKIVEGSQEVVAEAQATLKALPGEFRKGLNQVAKMFWIQFWLGIGLLAVSIAFQIFGYDILTYVFGATGGLTLVTTFITSSPIRLQKNRVDLAQWGMAFFSWFNTLLATNTTITMMLQSGTLTWEMFKDSHVFLLQITERTLWDIEELCEFSKVRTKSVKQSTEQSDLPGPNQPHNPYGAPGRPEVDPPVA